MIYFVSGCSLYREAIYQNDTSTAEFHEANKKAVEYRKKVVNKARNKLAARYKKFSKWLCSSYYRRDEDPFMSHFYDLKKPDDNYFIDWPPENIPRPSYEEIQKLMDLNDSVERFYDSVPKLKSYRWEIENHDIFGYYNSLEEIKDKLQKINLDDENDILGNTEYLFIEGLEEGLGKISDQKNIYLYSVFDRKWMNIESVSSGSILIDGEYLNGNLGLNFRLPE